MFLSFSDGDNVRPLLPDGGADAGAAVSKAGAAVFDGNDIDPMLSDDGAGNFCKIARPTFPGSFSAKTPNIGRIGASQKKWRAFCPSKD